MSYEELMKIINAVGEDNIIAIGFDNSMAKLFNNKTRPFSIDDNVESELDCLKFIEQDDKGNPYFVYIPFTHIQTISVGIKRVAGSKYGVVDNSDYSPASLRG